MPESELELLCAAFYEYLNSGHFNKKNGPAVLRFLEHMARRNMPASDAAPFTAASSSPADADRIGDLERQNLDLERELDKARQRLQELQDQLEQRGEEAEQCRLKLAQAEKRLAAHAAQELSGREALEEAQAFLDGLTPGMRVLMGAHYRLDELAAFLSQCGQFSRLNQLWEACGRAVLSGRSEPGMISALEYMLKLFNLASEQNPAALISPACGDTYRSEMHTRVDSDGASISVLLLPGLRNPGGQVLRNALVRLR